MYIINHLLSKLSFPNQFQDIVRNATAAIKIGRDRKVVSRSLKRKKGNKQIRRAKSIKYQAFSETIPLPKVKIYFFIHFYTQKVVNDNLLHIYI